MTPEQQALLREAFPASAIGKLPKGGAQLDYVGHAAVTDRLLKVDPDWTWEPLAFDERGLPLYDDAGGLWIRLTIAGVTRLGYGHADAKGGDKPKQTISDALRNAAMRFGVALDLWAKEDLNAPPAPEHATAEQVQAMLDTISQAESVDVLRSISDSARAYVFDDADKARLRDAFSARADELNAAKQQAGDAA